MSRVLCEQPPLADMVRLVSGRLFSAVCYSSAGVMPSGAFGFCAAHNDVSRVPTRPGVRPPSYRDRLDRRPTVRLYGLGLLLRFLLRCTRATLGGYWARRHPPSS